MSPANGTEAEKFVTVAQAQAQAQAVLDELSVDNGVRVVVLTGRDRAPS